MRKPNTIQYSSYMETCAENLAKSTQAETDRLITYFIQFQKLAEEVTQAFDYQNAYKLPQLDAMRLEILVKAFEQQLKSFETSFPAEIWNNGGFLLIEMSAFTDLENSIHDNEILPPPNVHQRNRFPRPQADPRRTKKYSHHALLVLLSGSQRRPSPLSPSRQRLPRSLPRPLLQRHLQPHHARLHKHNLRNPNPRCLRNQRLRLPQPRRRRLNNQHKLRLLPRRAVFQSHANHGRHQTWK